jgi:hypothetical protein
MFHRLDHAGEGPAEARRVGGLEADFYGIEGVADCHRRKSKILVAR